MKDKPRRGRPKLEVTRSRIIAVRVTQELFDRIEQLAVKDGIKVAAMAHAELERLVARRRT